MTLTAAISAATSSVTATTPTTTAASAGAGPSAADVAATVLANESGKNRQEQGYYGDSNANLSPAALDFLEKLPDLSYLLT
jgi:hypothetical protein